MWSTVAVFSVLVVAGLAGRTRVDRGLPVNGEARVSVNQAKSDRIFDFVKSSFRDNVKVLSPPQKVALNGSPLKNDSLFKVSHSVEVGSASAGRSSVDRGFPVSRAARVSSRQTKYDRIFDFVKSSSDYRDNVMVLSPPLKITLNRSPQKNDSLFRVTRSVEVLKHNPTGDDGELSKYETEAVSPSKPVLLKSEGVLSLLRGKGNPSKSEKLSSKSGRRIDILRASFDPLDSVLVMSPPLRVTLNNSPQKNDSLFKLSRMETNSEAMSKNGILVENVDNIRRPLTSQESPRRSDTSPRDKRAIAVALTATTTPNPIQEQWRFFSEPSTIPLEQFDVTPTEQEATEEHKWPRDFASFLLVPAMFFLGYAPLALWALKMLVYKGLFLSKLALLATIYMGLRTLVFATPLTPVKYFNYGYDNDRLNEITDPTHSWQQTS